MNITDAVAYRLARSTYRYRNEQWEVRDLDFGINKWDPSVPLDGFNHDEGIAVIAACPWAGLAESDL